MRTVPVTPIEVQARDAEERKAHVRDAGVADQHVQIASDALPPDRSK